LARWPDEWYGVSELWGIGQTDQDSAGFPVFGGEG
jgi:hypothetical protein